MAHAAPTAPSVTRMQLVWIALLALAHVALASAMRAFPVLATSHAVATMALGVGFALTTRHVHRIAYVAAYVAGADVLWRMNGASVFWEFGKFVVIAIFAIGVFRLRRSGRNRLLALAYFGLLLPSAMLTLVELDLDGTRQQLSFYLSGPLAITMAVIFASNCRLTVAQLRVAFVAYVLPVLGIGSLSFSLMIARQNLEFANGSNYAASGGFGPNQVSAVLGLAVLLLLLLALDSRLMLRLRVVALVLAAMLSVQTALTFARGGLFLAFAGIGISLVFIMARSGRGRFAVVVIALAAFALGNYVIEPELDAFTDGAFAARFTSSKSSGRDEFVASELTMFADNPVLGVGPGIGTVRRQELNTVFGASHTEYTRMLAEHGIFGVCAIVCLAILGYRAVRDAQNAANRAVAAAFVVWTFLFLAINGTRIAAPAVVFGLAFAVPVPARAALPEPRRPART